MKTPGAQEGGDATGAQMLRALYRAMLPTASRHGPEMGALAAAALLADLGERANLPPASLHYFLELAITEGRVAAQRDVGRDRAS